VSFIKLYGILTIFLLWLNVELRIDNEIVLILLLLVLGLLSGLALIFLANRILVNENIENSAIYILMGLAAGLTIFLVIINMFFTEYLASSELNGFTLTYLNQYGWSKTIDVIIPIFILLYFLWKIKKNTVASGHQTPDSE